MKCPFCGFVGSGVIDSRISQDLDAIRRRRECEKCRGRFTTYEKAVALALRVLKKDGRKEPFNREKVKAGIIKACEKRPVTQEMIEKTVNEIESRIKQMNKKEIPSQVIGDTVIKRLQKLDKVAYLRFASVYKQFSDINSFEEEVHSLLNKGRSEKTKIKRLKNN